MAQETPTMSRYRWIGISVVTVALIGWLLALYFWSKSTELNEDLQQHVALTGTASELEARIAILQTEAARAEADRNEGLGNLDQLERQLEDGRDQVANLEARSQTLIRERDALQAEIDENTGALSRLQESLAQARQEITDTTQEFSDVGERLEQARRQEATLQANLSDLTSEVARLSEEASGAEARVQAAREAEASLEQEVSAARQELEEIESTRGIVEQSVAALAQRRDELASDTAVAEEQMGTMQSAMVALSQSLAERGERLAELQSRVAELQQEAGQPALAAAMGLTPGAHYIHGPVIATFDPGNTFQMTNMRTGEAVTGQYALSEGRLTLSDGEGDLQGAAFPMQCGLAAEAAGFRVEDQDGSCTVFDGVLFDQAHP